MSYILFRDLFKLDFTKLITKCLFPSYCYGDFFFFFLLLLFGQVPCLCGQKEGMNFEVLRSVDAL